MNLKILAFGIARDILGGSPHVLELAEGLTVFDLKKMLLEKYPRFADLASLQVAVNEEFAPENLPLKSGDEVALIPPVSGG